MKLALGLITLAALLLPGCAINGAAGATSPFFKPEPGIFYRYGNFCGPQFPRYPQGASVPERIAVAQSIAPVDDIDRACKAHDICYEQRGHDDKSCDRLVRDGLIWPRGLGNYNHWRGDDGNRMACERLAKEIWNGVEFFKSRRNNNDLLSVPVYRQFVGAVSVSITAPMEMMLGMGFPETDGGCFSAAGFDYRPTYGVDLGRRGYGARVP